MRVCIVGSGTRFLSGLSYYTIRLANALAGEHDVSVIPMRQLLPTRLYPGWKRVGTATTEVQFDSRVRVFEGLDWYWFPTMIAAILFLRRQRPEVLIFQWWTGTVLHSYLLLAAVARLLNTKVVIEFHETLDTGAGELKYIIVQAYVRWFAPVFVQMADGYVVHSSHDLAMLTDRYGLQGRAQAVIPHGPYDHWEHSKSRNAVRAAPDVCLNILFFGVIRPYKGLEDLITAFEMLHPDEVTSYWLTAVGETWENFTLPEERIAKSPYRDRITFINRYVADEEVAAVFAGADAVVLPYHRGSASGPLHSAMSYGLPVVVSDVGGLTEAVLGYEGAILTPPQDPEQLCSALRRLPNLLGKRFADPHSWERTAERYKSLFMRVTASTQSGEVAEYDAGMGDFVYGSGHSSRADRAQSPDIREEFTEVRSPTMNPDL
jgi:glycosyltransferase involved in cell wall biosynthesis